MHSNAMRLDDANIARIASGVLLGRECDELAKRPVGFGEWPSKTSKVALGDTVIDSDESHILTVAPTAAGKGRNVIIPTLLSYAGSAIIIDPKGENAAITARRRSELGHHVAIIDPFGIVATTGRIGKLGKACLNPFDALCPESPDYESDCYMLVKQITGGQMSLQDRFWDQQAEDLMARLIAYIGRYLPRSQRHFGTLVERLSDPDLGYQLAVALDTVVPAEDGFVCEGFKNFLGHDRDKVQTSVRSTAMQHMTSFCGKQVGAALNSSTFDPAMLTRGEPITIYLVIPPHKLEAYGRLLRLWLAVLMIFITRRERSPDLPTLFVLDELAQLGPFPLLRSMVTLMRGYGVRAMLFLQDAAQLRAMFPNDYPTIVNNCGTVLTFGHNSLAMAKEMADLLGDIDAEALFSMPRSRLAVRRPWQRTALLERFDYLNDPLFAGAFEANRMFEGRD